MTPESLALLNSSETTDPGWRGTQLRLGCHVAIVMVLHDGVFTTLGSLGGLSSSCSCNFGSSGSVGSLFLNDAVKSGSTVGGRIIVSKIWIVNILQ